MQTFDRQAFDRQAFDGLADGELEELRTTFRRKALLARQDRLARVLLAQGRTPEDLAGMRLEDLAPSAEVELYRSHRAELGFDTSPLRRCWSTARGDPPPRRPWSTTCAAAGPPR